MKHIYIFGTIFFTVYGQLILKWRIGYYGAFPENFKEKLLYFVPVLFDIFILSGFLAAFLASLSWIAAMTEFELSYAYPFMSLSFVIVFIFSVLMFGETLNWSKVIGVSFILLGIFISSRDL